MPAKKAKNNKKIVPKLAAKPLMEESSLGTKGKMPKTRAPALVKVISIYHYVLAVILLLTGVFLLIGGNALLEGLAIPDSVGAGLLTATLAILVLVFAVLYFFVGLGLWKAKNWARIVAIVLAAIGLLGLKLTVTGVVYFIINVAIIVCLLCVPEVKKAFSRK